MLKIPHMLITALSEQFCLGRRNTSLEYFEVVARCSSVGFKSWEFLGIASPDTATVFLYVSKSCSLAGESQRFPLWTSGVPFPDSISRMLTLLQ